MKKIILILICLFVATAQDAVAQRRLTKKTNVATTPAPVLPTITLSEAIRQYRFSEAEEILLAQIESLESEGKSTEQAEAKLQTVRKAISKMGAVEQVTFIDSLTVPFEEIFSNLHYSDETGKIFSYQDYFKTGDQRSSVFLSQMKDKLFYAEKNNAGQYHILTRELEGKEWSDAAVPSGLNTNEDTNQNYPYMMSDGITLYYAAQGPESLGGYDIFMTRYDTDDHAFLAPENIGMPFNSPANDYLYIVDDYINLGWFVTDRNQPNGMVCIYTFIPNETRKTYDPSTMSENAIRHHAQIHSIRDTWTDRKAVDEALARLHTSKSENREQQADNTHSETFIINDQLVYSKAADFKNPDARKKYEFWMEGLNQKNQLQQKLDTLRMEFSRTKSQKVGDEILTIENNLRKLSSQLREQEKEIRSIELK